MKERQDKLYKAHMPYNFTHAMSVGWTGSEVTALQDVLRTLGYNHEESICYVA